MERNKMDKILMIGPVYPYKSGVAHYTGSMYRALCKKYEVTMVSYKFQYPKFLYRKEQKEESNSSLNIKNTKYWIHTANPFNWIGCAQKIKKEYPDFIIIQWLHPYFAPCYWFMAILLRKYKILFLCHNVFPHERFFLDKFLTKLALKQGDCFIVQSSADARDLKSIIPNATYRQTLHPTFDIYRFENLSKEAARERMNLDKNQKVLLFFGLVKEYKGLKYLIRALPAVIQVLPDIKLLIAGDFGSDKEVYYKLIQKENVEKNIGVYEGYIPDRDVEKFFTASDLVVLPYESATQSGIAQIAFEFEKPIIVTNVGGLPEAVINEKTGYVVETQNPKKLSEAIIRFFLENKETEFRDNIRKEAYRFSWNKLVEVVGELKDELL